MAEDSTSVLVTGFGPFLDIKTNPSFEIVQRLPSEMAHHGRTITIHAHPNPLRVSYHECATVVPELLDAENTKPDIVIHIGLDVENGFFHVEKGAERDGYHQYPDEDRKVFTKAENKKFWGKGPSRLDSDFDFEEVLEVWRREVGSSKGKGKGGYGGKGRGEDLRITDGVGSYICGFVYYLSLEKRWVKKEKKNVVFLHVPILEGREGVEKGVDVVLGLVKALVEQMQR